VTVERTHEPPAWMDFKLKGKGVDSGSIRMSRGALLLFRSLRGLL